MSAPSQAPRPNPTENRSAFGGPRFGMAGVPGETSKNFGPTARRLMARMRPERLGLIAVVVLALLSVTFSAFGPMILGHATDIIFDALRSEHGVSGIDFAALYRVLLGALTLYLFSVLFAYLQAYLLAGIVQRTMFRLRASVEDKLNRLPLDYIDRQSRGDLLSRVTNDIDNIAQSLQQTLSQLLQSSLSLTGISVMMLVISPLMALVPLIMIPLSFGTMAQIAKRSKERFLNQWTHTGALNAQVEEAFTGHALVKVFGRHREIERRFDEKNEELYQASFGAQVISGIIPPAMMSLGNLNYVAIAVIGGLRVSAGTMSLGGVQAFIQYSRQFTQPLMQIASMINVLQSGIASTERVFDFLDAKEQSEDAPTAFDMAPPRGRVEFKHVSFSYDAAKPLITDLSLVAEPGQTVAIVGPTGAGKTTLVNLLMRFYELDGGTILLDGHDIATLRRPDLRSKIGMVLQDTWLFGGTIRANIAYGNPEATNDQILDAARATYVDRFVRALPDGYDTLIEEGGNISAGEKQLITIARAFLADPAILILDEATSSVDTRTEMLIQQAMSALRSRRTSFVIAHRLSTIRDADVILVMDSGKIVEQGTHAELLARGGAYFTLYNAQFSAPASEVA